MAIDKAFYEAPQGIAAIGAEQPDIEIELIAPMDMEVDIDVEEDDFSANLAEELSESVLTMLAGDLVADFEGDIASRKDWIQTYVDGLELLGLKIEERAEPWEGACGVYHPILAEAVVKFQSETIMETFPASGPVRTQIIGK